MKLVRLWDADIEKAFELHGKFLKDENGFMNEAFGYDREEFENYVKNKQRHSQGLGLKEGYVPDTVFILVDDEKYVGRFNIRHYLTEALAKGAGHVGYGIAREYRGLGYGTKGLKLAIEEANKLGIDEIYMSVHKDNEASIKVQLNNGAVIHHEDDKEFYTRIKKTAQLM